MRKFLTAAAIAAGLLERDRGADAGAGMADARHHPHDRALSGGRRHRRGRAHRRQISAERLHQTIIVENRGGANGQVGLQALKQSPPDGYTMAMTSDLPMTVNKWVYKNRCPITR